MRKLAYSIFVLSALFAISGSSAQQATKDPFDITAEEQKFIDDFKALLNKYPKQAKRFVLADMGDTVTTIHIGQTVWECRHFPGDPTGQMTCTHHHKT